MNSLNSGYYEKYLVNRPSRVYKYQSFPHPKKYTENSIKNHYFWLSNPFDFNDPFDCYPSFIKGFESADEVKSYYHQFHNEEITIEIARTIYENPDLLDGEIKDNINGHGVCCFSRIPDSILMWSHYSNYHKGICIGFDTSDDPAFNRLINIQYLSSDFLNVKYSDPNEEAVFLAMIHKSADWKYEEESRIILDKPGELSYKKQSLKEVIFGAKMNTKDEQLLMDLLLESGYKNVEFIKAKLSKRSFKLEFHKLN